MRSKIIYLLKNNVLLLRVFTFLLLCFLRLLTVFIPIKKNRMLFCSFGGRSFDDSPRALYDEIIKRKEFENWEIYWAFTKEAEFDVPRGKKIKIDSFDFFKILVSSKIWIDNSGLDRGTDFKRKGIISIQTWHGTPLKKICGEENNGGIKLKRPKRDNATIRCCQSDYDLQIFSRVFNANPKCFLKVDLPRNDRLISSINDEELNNIKLKLGIPLFKKVILYMPTYREFLVNDNKENIINTPIDFRVWREKFGEEFVFLVRAHYAVSKMLGLENDGFVFDVSRYENLVDLYLISDYLISDYSSAFFDFGILERPMFCYAYDFEEYNKIRGLYLNLDIELPCGVDYSEKSLMDHIQNLDLDSYSKKAHDFKKKYVPYPGNSCSCLINEIKKRLKE